MLDVILECAGYALMAPASVAGYRFCKRRYPSGPKELPISGARNVVGPRRYECMCQHLPTTHERIVGRDPASGATFVRFGKCKNKDSNCPCNGYMGPLPSDPGVMIYDDMGVEWHAADELKKEIEAQKQKIAEMAKEATLLQKNNSALTNRVQEANEKLSAEKRKQLESPGKAKPTML